MVAIITIVRFIKPYLPSKVNYRSFAWQLPFVLMSNQVLRCIGRESQVVQITPIISPASLKALVVDTATIFSLFCSNNAPSKMYLQDYSGHLIQEKSRLHHKDAVVGSFFDMAKIHTIAKSYGMEFGQRLQLLPGMKTVRINGTVRVTQTRPKVPETTTAEAGVPQDAEENQEDDEPLKRLNAQKETLQELLVDSTKQHQEFLVKNGSVRSQRKEWKAKPDERDDIARRRDALKLETREMMTRIRDAKEQIQATSRAIYEYRHPNTAINSNPITVDKKPCLYKAEDCELDGKVPLGNAIFGGTDNGIVKTTETVFFDIERFTLHLELYRHFHISGKSLLGEGVLITEHVAHSFIYGSTTVEDPMELDNVVPPSCLTLPEAHTVGPKQIAQQTGLTWYTSSLVNRKKRTSAGHQVMEAEELLSHCSLRQSATVAELDRNYQQHEQCREPLRAFYYSNSMCKKRRSMELSKQKAHDRIAAAERKASGYKPATKVPGSTDKTLLLFVGDRGFGVGSRIKGHQRFGGTWKQQIHGRYTPTMVTNEYNSSQTCLFCFRKLSHPMKVVEGEVKATTGSFVCLNDQCPNAFRVVCRDQVSALAIGLSGLASLLFGVTFPCFDPRPSRAKRQLFNDTALSFLEQKQQQAPPFDDGNTF